jgi:hypothetical protein
MSKRNNRKQRVKRVQKDLLAWAGVYDKGIDWLLGEATDPFPVIDQIGDAAVPAAKAFNPARAAHGASLFLTDYGQEYTDANRH